MKFLRLEKEYLCGNRPAFRLAVWVSIYLLD